MNNRINELVWQAGAKFYSEPLTRQVIGVSMTFEQVEKFVEQVVQDCIDVALDRKKLVENQVVFDPKDHAWNKARIQQSQQIVDKIKEHFGFED